MTRWVTPKSHGLRTLRKIPQGFRVKAQFNPRMIIGQWGHPKFPRPPKSKVGQGRRSGDTYHFRPQAYRHRSGIEKIKWLVFFDLDNPLQQACRLLANGLVRPLGSPVEGNSFVLCVKLNQGSFQVARHLQIPIRFVFKKAWWKKGCEVKKGNLWIIMNDLCPKDSRWRKGVDLLLIYQENPQWFSITTRQLWLWPCWFHGFFGFGLWANPQWPSVVPRNSSETIDWFS